MKFGIYCVLFQEEPMLFGTRQHISLMFLLFFLFLPSYKIKMSEIPEAFAHTVSRDKHEERNEGITNWEKDGEWGLSRVWGLVGEKNTTKLELKSLMSAENGRL